MADGSRCYRSRSPTPRAVGQYVDSYYTDPFMRNPMTSPTAPPFQYGAAYGYVPSHSAVVASTHTYPPPPPPRSHTHTHTVSLPRRATDRPAA